MVSHLNGEFLPVMLHLVAAEEAIHVQEVVSHALLTKTYYGSRITGQVPVHGSLPQTVSGIQDRAASTFEKFGDLLRLVSLDTHLLQRLAKVLKKPVEMPVV